MTTALARRSSVAGVYAALVLVQVFFGSLPIAVKVALRDLTSPALALIRVASAALLFQVLHSLLIREGIRDRRDYGLLALYAVFGVVLNQLLYITALTLTTAMAAQTLVTVGPAMTLLIAILARKETATPLKWLGIAVAWLGALWLVGAGVRTGNALGNLLALLNVAAYSVYLVISRGLLRKYNPLTVINWVFTFGAIGIAPWGIVPLSQQITHLTATGWVAIAFIVLFPTVGAYWLIVYALKRIASSVVSVFVYMQPVITAMIAIPVLHEGVSPQLIPAALVIVAGVSLTLWEGRRSGLSSSNQEVVNP